MAEAYVRTPSTGIHQQACLLVSSPGSLARKLISTPESAGLSAGQVTQDHWSFRDALGIKSPLTYGERVRCGYIPKSKAAPHSDAVDALYVQHHIDDLECAGLTFCGGKAK